MNAPIPLKTLLPETASPARQRRRASTQMTRLLVASPLVWLAGCAPQPAPVLQQDLYLNKQDCVADWGEEEKCVEGARASSSSSGSSGGGNWRTPYYHGPSYWSDERANLTRQNLEASRRLASFKPDGATTHAGSTKARSTRGFGSTGRIFSSGGG